MIQQSLRGKKFCNLSCCVRTQKIVFVFRIQACPICKQRLLHRHNRPLFIDAAAHAAANIPVAQSQDPIVQSPALPPAVVPIVAQTVEQTLVTQAQAAVVAPPNVSANIPNVQRQDPIVRPNVPARRIQRTESLHSGNLRRNM